MNTERILFTMPDIPFEWIRSASYSTDFPNVPSSLPSLPRPLLPSPLAVGLELEGGRGLRLRWDGGASLFRNFVNGGVMCVLTAGGGGRGQGGGEGDDVIGVTVYHHP